MSPLPTLAYPYCSENLGGKLSEGTGHGTLDLYPLIHEADSPKGYDNSASVLVNGNLIIEKGSVIEGKIVIMGDFKVNPNSGFVSLIKAEMGSQVIPNNGIDAIIVGGDLAINVPNVTFMEPGYGNIVYKGTRTGYIPSDVTQAFPLDSNSGVSYSFQSNSLDLSEWLNAFLDLEQKGTYWGNMNPNGVITGMKTNTLTFKAGNTNAVQVFHIKAIDLTFYVGRHIKFHSTLVGKTILINVKADSNGKAHVKNLADFIDTTGAGGFFFFLCAFITNIVELL